MTVTQCLPPAALHTCWAPTHATRGKQSCQRLESFRIYFPPCVAFSEPSHSYGLCAPNLGSCSWALVPRLISSQRGEPRPLEATKGTMPNHCLCPGRPGVSEGVN